MQVNFFGIKFSMDVFLPLLRAAPTKKIINISSALADIEFLRRTDSMSLTAYACSKASMNVLTTQYANIFANDGFICVSMSPGFVNTVETNPGKGAFQQ